jgi:hypothetical protein
MTTKELIQRLQEEDPEGNTEVVVGGEPIHWIENLPAYYDGRCGSLILDHSKDPYYNIVGYRVRESGRKVRLGTVDLEDVLYDNPNATVDLSDLQEREREQWEEKVQKVRREAGLCVGHIHSEKHNALAVVEKEELK